MTPPAPESSGGFPITNPQGCLHEADLKRHEEAIARLERSQQDQDLDAVRYRAMAKGTRRDVRKMDKRLESIEKILSGKNILALAQTLVTIGTGALVLWAAFHGNMVPH